MSLTTCYDTNLNGTVVKNHPANAGDARDTGLTPGVRNILWRRKWQLDPVFLAWRIWWTKETGGLQSKGEKEPGDNWVNTTAMMIPTAFHSYMLPSTPGEVHQFQDQSRSLLTERWKSLHMTQSFDCKHTTILVCAMESIYSPRISLLTHIYNLMSLEFVSQVGFN